MSTIDKNEVIGRRIVDIIVSAPNIPVTMGSQSYSQGFLRLDSGQLINLGAYAPPLSVCDESEVCDLTRDKKTEEEFRSAVGQTIVEMILPGEADDGDIRITTANGFVISFASGLFWIRPSIKLAVKPNVTAVQDNDSLEQKLSWKFW